MSRRGGKPALSPASPRLAFVAAAAVMVAAVVLAVGLAGCRVVHRQTVLLYGDSLADESLHWFVSAFPPPVQVEAHVLGGTAICDFLPQIQGDLRRTHPVAAVFEFAGNGVTKCTQVAGNAPTTDELAARYRADAVTATQWVTGAAAAAWWMGAPVNRDAGAEIGNAAIRSIYEALPRQFPNSHYVDAGAAVEQDGRYTDTLPCLPEEPCAHVNGTNDNQVRAPDGGHLCPQHVPFTDSCPVYSSGAYRFGVAMADPLLASLHLPRVRVKVR